MLSIRVVPVPSHIRESDWNVLISQISPERKNKIGRFVRKEDAYKSLLGEVLIRSTVAECTGSDELQLFHTSYGKPYVQSKPMVSFNISHSGSWVAMIWTVGQSNVGIDVERIAPIDLTFAEHVLTAEELRILASTSGLAQRDCFYRFWTLKESYLKALGTGLSKPMRSFSLLPIGETWYSPEAEGFQFRSYRLDQDHMLSACSDSEVLPEHYEQISFSALYEHFLTR